MRWRSFIDSTLCEVFAEAPQVHNQAKRLQTWQLLGVLRLDEIRQRNFFS